jgi:hypothetical protein
MGTIYRGTPVPQIQDQIFDFDPQRGRVYRTNYRGISQGQMLSYWETYIGLGMAARVTFHMGDTASLEVEDSTQAYTIDVWQILGNEESRDGLSHPALIAALGSSADDYIALMREHLANNDKESDVFAADGDLYGLDAAVKRFYSLQARGSTEYRHGQYVLRHSTNAPNRWAVNISDSGVDEVYTPAQLLTEVQDGSLWVYPLPGRLAYKLGAIASPTAQTNYLWGWLKSASTETSAANNRVDITTEYTLEQFSTDYYTAY